MLESLISFGSEDHKLGLSTQYFLFHTLLYLHLGIASNFQFSYSREYFSLYISYSEMSGLIYYCFENLHHWQLQIVLMSGSLFFLKLSRSN